MFLIGCPIYKRSWAFPQWYTHLMVAIEKAKLSDIGFVFVIDETDSATRMVLNYIPYPTKIIEMKQANPSRERIWNSDRYQEMVLLRNELLKTVRGIAPDLFLSLDSDIFLHPDTLKNLTETLYASEWAAVGGKTYMTERETRFPSYANINPSNGALQRMDTIGIIPVQVIMAIKLMKPEAYRVDYEYSDKGEDVGWSLAVRKAGMRVGFDGRVASKHVMKPEMADKWDARVGF